MADKVSARQATSDFGPPRPGKGRGEGGGRGRLPENAPPPHLLETPGDGRSSTPIEGTPTISTMASDPLADLFRTGGVALVGSEGDQIPEEIANVFEEHGFDKKSFRVMLKEVPDGSTPDNPSALYIKSWFRSIPTIDWIGANYGPGTYLLIFSWRGSDDNGVLRYRTRDMMFQVSDKFLDEYKKTRFDKKMKALEDRREKLRTAKIDKELDEVLDTEVSAEPQQKQSAKEYVNEIVSVARDLGLTQRQGPDWNTLLPALLTAVPAILKMLTERNDNTPAMLEKMMGLIVAQSTGHNQQLVEALKSVQGEGSGQKAIKEFRDMVLGAIDLREAISGKEESTADKIFHLLETIGPQVLSMAAQPRAVRAINPMYAAAKGFMAKAPEFQALKADPGVLPELVAKLDAFYGWAQADQILEVSGYQRPPQCPRLPEQMLPAGTNTEETTKQAQELLSGADGQKPPEPAEATVVA
jgi:hypothetical protein